MKKCIWIIGLLLLFSLTKAQHEPNGRALGKGPKKDGGNGGDKVKSNETQSKIGSERGDPNDDPSSAPHVDGHENKKPSSNGPGKSNKKNKNKDWFSDAVGSVGDSDYGQPASDKPTSFLTFTEILKTCPNIEPHRLSSLANFTYGNGEKIEVDVQFVPKFLDIMEVEENIALSGLLKLTWMVECEGDGLEGFRHINLGSRKSGSCCSFSDVWLPPVIHDNAKSNFAIIDGFDHDLIIKPYYNENGKVLLHFSWYRFGIFSAECPMEMANFPFDSQTCSFTFSSKFSHMGTMVFKDISMVGGINMESTDSWDLIESESEIDELIEPGDRARFTYTFKRRHTYFVNNILLPALFLGFLGEVVAFALPVDTSDRPSFAVTMLISLTYIHGIVLSSIPISTESVFLNNFTLTHGIHSLIITIYFTAMCWFCDSFRMPMHKKMIRYNREKTVEEDTKQLVGSTCCGLQWFSPFRQSENPTAMKLYRFIDVIVFLISTLYFLSTSIWALNTYSAS